MHRGDDWHAQCRREDLAALLRHDAATGPTLTDFRTPIMAAAIMAAVSTLDALALSPDAGSLVSGVDVGRTTA